MKAQIFSLDLIIASGIFILILLSVAWAWDYSNEKIYLDETRNDLELVARNAVSSLIKTEGNPKDWDNILEADFNENNIHSLGLVKTNKGINVLDPTKIQRLVDLNSTKYPTYKKILGILGPNYEFELKIAVWDGTYADTYALGLTPNNNAKNIVNLDRFTLINNKWAKVNLKVWENE